MKDKIAGVDIACIVLNCPVLQFQSAQLLYRWVISCKTCKYNNTYDKVWRGKTICRHPPMADVWAYRAATQRTRQTDIRTDGRIAALLLCPIRWDGRITRLKSLGSISLVSRCAFTTIFPEAWLHHHYFSDRPFHVFSFFTYFLNFVAHYGRFTAQHVSFWAHHIH